MTAIAELKGSRGGTVRGDNPRRELIYGIRGTDDVAEVEAAIEAESPVSFRGLVRQDYQVEDKGGGLWGAIIRYGKQSVQSPKFSFDTGDGTKHISQSLKTTKYAPPGQTAPDFKGAIGVDDTGVKGVDVPDGVFAFTETHYFPITKMTPAYVGKLYRLRGKTNREPWVSSPMYPGGTGFSFAAGEVRFRKATGSTINDEYVELTFHFEGSPNATGLTHGDITGIAKKGWEYLWIRYRDTMDQNQRVKVPAAVYVEQVSHEGDFNDLLLGEIVAVLLTSSPSGYLLPPSVAIGPPPSGGTNATAMATINSLGEVTAVVVTDPGSGYTTTPSVTFSGAPGGNVATAIAILG